MFKRLIGREVIEMGEFGESSYRRFPQGDRSALEELIRTYSDSLVRFAYSYVKSSAAAEDVAEDTFAALFVKGKHFGQEPQLRAWLYKVARSKCIDYLRRHKREIPLADVENVLHCDDAEADVARCMRNETIYVCMQALPEQYREVLQLTYFDGFSLQQTCRIMGKSSKQVYNLHARSKIALKQLLEKEGITHEDI